MSAFIALWIGPRAEPTAEFTLRASPPRAEVFEENRRVGVTPLTVRMRPHESRTFRLLRRGCADAMVTLRADDLLAQAPRARLPGETVTLREERVVSMPPCATARLDITSIPPGAEVLLDGRREGVTPLKLAGLAPGRRLVQLNHPKCFPWRGMATLEPGVRTRLHQELEDRVIPLYREMIENEPGRITHYTDLAHYLTIRGEFAEAGDVLRQCYDAVKRRDADDVKRFYQELAQTYIRYYQFPEESESESVRPVCRELMERALDEKLWNVKQLQRYLKQMDAYDRRNSRR